MTILFYHDVDGISNPSQSIGSNWIMLSVEWYLFIWNRNQSLNPLLKSQSTEYLHKRLPTPYKLTRVHNYHGRNTF